MKIKWSRSPELPPDRHKTKRIWSAITSVVVVFSTLVTWTAVASEDLPRPYFAQWADVPQRDQFILGLLYEQSDAYNIWEGTTRRDITVKANSGESYGIDIRQGYLSLDYGLTEKWAMDIEFGGTTVGYRSFNTDANVQDTIGIMDSTIGFRYQIFKEGAEESKWLPTLTFRAAGFLQGTYNRIPFAPGYKSAGIEPSLLLRKHFGWDGLGVWADTWYRWMHTTGNDMYSASVGFFQQIQRWELDAGYRHLQAITGENLALIPPPPATEQNGWGGITYQADNREISESVDAGFSYITKKRHLRWAFHARKTFEGSNTDSKLWLGGSLDIPFDHLFGREKEESK